MPVYIWQLVKSSPGGPLCEQMSEKWTMIGSAASRKHGAP